MEQLPYYTLVPGEVATYLYVLHIYQSHFSASDGHDGAFLFSFVCVMYLNIASNLYGNEIKSNLRKIVFMNDFHLCTLESA